MNLYKLQKKLTNNNLQLSDIYKRAVEEYCDSISMAENIFVKITANCDKLQDHFLGLEILAMKT